MKDKKEKEELLKFNAKTKKRKRSYSGIELPAPEEEIDDAVYIEPKVKILSDEQVGIKKLPKSKGVIKMAEIPAFLITLSHIIQGSALMVFFSIQSYP